MRSRASRRSSTASTAASSPRSRASPHPRASSASADFAAQPILGSPDASAAADAHLARDPVLGPLVAARPGLRVPGTTDGGDWAIRAVLGQQISVAAARTLAARLVAADG